MGSGCMQPTPPPVSTEPKVNSNLVQWGNTNDTVVDTGLEDSAIALALLDADDVETLGVFEDPLPSTIELNDHLDGDYLEQYDFFVSRLWYDRASGNSLMTNAITKYLLPSAAVEEIDRLGGEGSQLNTIADPVGDAQVVYYDAPLFYYGSPASDAEPATLTYRFTVGQYGVKVAVVDTGDVLDDTSVIQARLLEQASALAQVQYDKLSELLYRTVVATVTNDAIEHLPISVIGATLIGTVPLSAEEWLGLTYDLQRETIAGYVSGGLRRFQLEERPDEVVEVAVMEFSTPEQAQAFRDELLDGEDAASGTEIELPATISNSADAILQADTLVELQAAVDNYWVDITIYAPFATAELAAAEVDLIAISEEVLTSFQP